MDLSEPFRACLWGFFSAVSLPLGAALGLRFAPGHKWTSSLMAFGGGALLAALTLELVAESIRRSGFWVMAAGFLGGALLFLFLDHLLNSRGGFLRKTSTTVVYLTEQKRHNAETLLERLSRVEILRELPPEEVEALVSWVRPAEFKAGETVFEQGSHGDRLYLIEEGSAEVLHAGEGEAPHRVAALGPGDTFGEMALLTGEARFATVRAATDLKTLTIAKEDFDRLLEESPRLSREVTELLARRLGEATRRQATAARDAKAWAAAAKASIQAGDVMPTAEDIHNAEAGGGAPMAIWLGILLDGIPESLVIGASMIGGKSVSPTLFVGVFLANVPEALSSAVGMRRQGMSVGKVMWMWGSLALMTGAGAFVGELTFGKMPAGLFSGMEAMAAGAMLAMISETMLPEAVEQGGPATGLMTVLGFLAALYSTTLGAH